MKRILGTRRKTEFLLGALSALAFSSSLNSFSHAHADTDSPEVAAQKEKVVAELCQDGGRLAKCAGKPAADCPKMARELVNLCAEPAVNSFRWDPEKAFELCFWAEYRKRNPRIEHSKECVAPRGENPLLPLSPEQQRLQQPLAQFKATAVAEATRRAHSHHDTEH